MKITNTIILIFTFSLFTNICLYAQNESRWIQIKTLSTGTIVYYDKETVDSRDNDLTVWLKYDFINKILYGEKIDYSMYKIKFNIKKQEYLVNEILVCYNGNTSRWQGKNIYHPIPPESVYEDVFRVLSFETYEKDDDRFQLIYEFQFQPNNNYCRVYLDKEKIKYNSPININCWVKYKFDKDVNHYTYKIIKDDGERWVENIDTIKIIYKNYNITKLGAFQWINSSVIDKYDMNYSIKQNKIIKGRDVDPDYEMIIPLSIIEKIYFALFDNQ